MHTESIKKNGPCVSYPFTEISDSSVLRRTPLVSVHMITYNHEPYIAKAIEGVLQQSTFFSFELIIGEDYSTDGTRAIVLEYQKKYPDVIRVLLSDKNVGSNENYRRVGSACRGKYVAYCEGDDFWHHPGKLSKQVQYLEQYSNIGMIHSDVVWHNVDTGQIVSAHYKKKYLHHDQENVLRAIIEFEYHVMTCSVVARKNLLDEILNECKFEFSDKHIMADLQMWIEIAYRSKIKYLDEPLATYNALPESACRSKSADYMINVRTNIAEMQMHYADKYGGINSSEIKRKVIRQSMRGQMALAYHARRPDLSKEIIKSLQESIVHFDLLTYLYFVGAQNIVTYCLFRPLIPVLVNGKKMSLLLVRMFGSRLSLKQAIKKTEYGN